MAESKIRDDNYYQVTGWMLNRLGLKGTALQVYAIIYGFTQDGESEFKGSLQYLMDFTNASRPTVIKALQDLTEKGLILKTENRVNGVKLNTYKVSLQVVKKLYWGSKETLLGDSQVSLPGGSQKTLPNNKSLDNKSSDNKGDKKEALPLVDYNETTFSEAMKAKVDQWLRYKSERREEYQPTGLQSLISQIQNNVNKYGEDAVMELIGECMANGYRGIIFDRLKPKQPTGGRKEPVPGWMQNKDRERTFNDCLKKDMDALKKFMDGQEPKPELSPEYKARAAALKQQFQGETRP